MVLPSDNRFVPHEEELILEPAVVRTLGLCWKLFPGGKFAEEEERIGAVGVRYLRHGWKHQGVLIKIKMAVTTE